MSRRALAISLIACSAILCRAAELGAECARRAPIADHGAPAVADERTSEKGPRSGGPRRSSSSSRACGSMACASSSTTSSPCPTPRLAAGHQRDDAQRPQRLRRFLACQAPRTRRHRLPSRAGPLPPTAASASARPRSFAGFTAEIGESSERRLVASGELHLMMFHLAGEHDERSRTRRRVGFAVRVPGSVNAWSWSGALDWVTTHRSDLPTTAPNSRGFGIPRRTHPGLVAVNHVLVAAQAALASNATRDDGWQGTSRPERRRYRRRPVSHPLPAAGFPLLRSFPARGPSASCPSAPARRSRRA